MSLTVHSEQPSMTQTHFPVFGFASSLFSSVPSLNSEEANTFVWGGLLLVEPYVQTTTHSLTEEVESLETTGVQQKHPSLQMM